MKRFIKPNCDTCVCRHCRGYAHNMCVPNGTDTYRCKDAVCARCGSCLAVRPDSIRNILLRLGLIGVTTMRVLKGSGVNADTMEIVVSNGSQVLLEQKYYYGYGISYDEAWATPDKPLDKDVISRVAKQFDVAPESIVYGTGANVFKGGGPCTT